MDYVAGVMAFNDVSARDLQFASSQWTSGKVVDTFAPTLEPGDVIATRTPTGVGMGRKPPLYMRPGATAFMSAADG